ncbi:MAG: TonB-dependent receptor plug domain-containing protein, partial [Schleiferiaceae bacterium]
MVNIFGTRGRGNTGTDLNAIPAFAIDRVEVLRDGASAQYGSDAIAGVINVVTKRSVGTNLYQSFGIASRGDGGSSITGLNYGKRFGRGFVNVTGEYSSRAKTYRDAGDYREMYGDASSTNSGLWLNSELPVGSFTAYVFGGLNHRVGDAFAWTRSASDDRNIPSIYPDGFNPQITATIDDRSVTAGIKGELSGWDADLYVSSGANKFDYFIHNTLNTSMGATSPTAFNAGGFGLSQNLAGLSLNRYFGAKGKGLNVALGTEGRSEQYYIFAGEEASWQNYDPTKASGSQGFPGFRPSNEVNEGRTALGAFADLEWDVNQRLLVSGAFRFENYSDFGSTANGKLAARLALTEKVALRGSFSTGFRAPSLAQMYFNSTFTNFVSGVAVES